MTKKSIDDMVANIGPFGVPDLPNAALGLYPAGQCDDCGLMVFHHAAMGQQDKVYTCCGRDCSHQQSLRVPDSYHPTLERKGVQYVFTLIDELQKGSRSRAVDATATELVKSVADDLTTKKRKRSK